MKKLVVAAAVLFNFVSSGMDQFNDYVLKWSAKVTAPARDRWGTLNRDDFSTKPFKDKLLGEMNDDHHAQKAFELFHEHDFTVFSEYWIQNNSNMLPENAGKFKDLVILSAIISNLIDIDLQGEHGVHIEPYASNVKKIIKIAGGLNNVSSYNPQFPQFSFEMFFCVTIDTQRGGGDNDPLISQASKEICSDIYEGEEKWPLKEEKWNILGIVGCREDAGGGGGRMDFDRCEE
jgi:hypothetical protein